MEGETEERTEEMSDTPTPLTIGVTLTPGEYITIPEGHTVFSYMQELERKLAESEKVRKFACADWADTHTRIEQMAKDAGVVVKQQGDCFVCELQIVEAVCAKLAEVTRERDAPLASKRPENIQEAVPPS